jgi:hypothetical protein
MEQQSPERESPQHVTDHLKQFAAPLDGVVKVYDRYAGDPDGATPESDQ